MAGTKVTADVITDASITVDKVHSQFKTASALGSSATVNVQTSYNNNFRKQYASIGSTYDASNDIFTEESPYESWTLDSNFDWVAPIAYPSDGQSYEWNEETQSWDLMTE